MVDRRAPPEGEAPSVRAIPLTVIGGYLGAGKTTLVNAVLRDPGGRRLGVIVNDFGSVPVDAGLLRASTGDDGIIALPNGCVCCAAGLDLREALEALVAREPAVDHVVVEVSGVADPSTAAAWATVAPFAPAGVIVLAAADDVVARARDRFVGSDVTRQLRAADLVVVTKPDRCAPGQLAEVHRWIDGVTGGRPRIDVVRGHVAAEVVLGVDAVVGGPPPGDADHGSRYETFTWTAPGPISRTDLDAALAAMLERFGGRLLRLKGVVALVGGEAASVQGVGHRIDVVTSPAGVDIVSALTVIAVAPSHDDVLPH